MGLDFSRRNFLKLGISGGLGLAALAAAARFGSTGSSDEDSRSLPPASGDSRTGGAKSYVAQSLGLVSAPLAAAGSTEGPAIVDIGLDTVVKFLFVFDEVVPEDETFASLYSSVEHQCEAFVCQVETCCATYLTRDGRAAVLVWPKGINDIGGQVQDWIFAAHDDFAHVIDDYDFDPSTGVLSFDPDVAPFNRVQFQVMVRVPSLAEAPSTRPYLTVDDEAGLCAIGSGPVSLASWDVVTRIALLSPGTDVSLDDLDVYVNGMDTAMDFDEGAGIIAETGELVIPIPPIGLSELRIRVRPRLSNPFAARTALAIRTTNMGFWPWMNGKLAYRDDLESQVGRTHMNAYYGYGFNIHTNPLAPVASGDSAHSSYGNEYTDPDVLSNATLRENMRSIVSYVSSNFDQLAQNVYVNKELASDTFDPRSIASVSHEIMLSSGGSAASVGLESSVSLPASGGGTVPLTWSNVRNGRDHAGDEGAVVAVTHGMTLPSDKRSSPLSSDPENYYPKSGGQPLESWWDPVRNAGGNYDPVVTVATCTHAAVSDGGDGISDNTRVEPNYVGRVLFRVLEVNMDASTPYVVMVFFSPKKYIDENDQQGQSASSILKFPLEKPYGSASVRKQSTL